jgi:hypothetical protein
MWIRTRAALHSAHIFILSVLSVFLEQVLPPSSYVPGNDADIGKINNLLGDFRATVREIRSGGDIIRTFRYIGSIASMFIDYSNVRRFTENVFMTFMLIFIFLIIISKKNMIILVRKF